jgi:glutaredoxin
LTIVDWETWWQPFNGSIGNRQSAIDNLMNIRIYTTSWCPDCRQAKRFLEEHELLYEEFDIEADPGAAKLVERANNGKRKVPTFDVDGRIFACSPFSAQNLKQALGL